MEMPVVGSCSCWCCVTCFAGLVLRARQEWKKQEAWSVDDAKLQDDVAALAKHHQDFLKCVTRRCVHTAPLCRVGERGTERRPASRRVHATVVVLWCCCRVCLRARGVCCTRTQLCAYGSYVNKRVP